MTPEEVASHFQGFVAMVRLHDATYERDGKTYIVPEWMDFSPVPYVEPEKCCCGEKNCNMSGSSDVPSTCVMEDNYPKGEHGWGMCRSCRTSWEEDHEVILPSLA